MRPEERMVETTPDSGDARLSSHGGRRFGPIWRGEYSCAVNQAGHGSRSIAKNDPPSDKHSSVVVALSFPHLGALLTGAFTPPPPTDDLGERASELGAHRAVQDEVDCTVDDDCRVPDVAQRYVDVVKYTPVYSA